MKKIGLFYGGTTAKTAVVALKIQEAFAENEVLIPIEGATRKEFESFDNIIAGTSTWFDGELPTYWDEFMPEIESIDMTGKKVALFGLGDQERYPDNFVDGIGILAEAFTKSNAELIGFMPTTTISPNQGPLRKGISWDFPSISRTSPNKRRNGY